ncbi:MAG: hypothetical protein GF330_07040 [Candidatus Eisenbacteria bacterium]|nr:hypothetical protein [Candidatus Eisenbacteria bacterium]
MIGGGFWRGACRPPMPSCPAAGGSRIGAVCGFAFAIVLPRRIRASLRAARHLERRCGVTTRRLRCGILSALVFVAATAIPAAVPLSDPPLFEQSLGAGEARDALPPLRPPVRSDTLWFGGDDGQGIAYEGGLWDWDAIVSDPFQGWTSIDRTCNPKVWFGWVEADSFVLHGDPCVPCLTDSCGMIWCGIHEDEALERDFVNGMGYANHMCQRALSPSFTVDPPADSISIGFLYFNDTETRYDYTHVYLLGRDAEEALIDELLVSSLDGEIGSPEAPASYLAGLSPGTLHPDVVTLRLELRMTSDGGWSDEDGHWESECGPFGADELALRVGATEALFAFNDGPQGWSFERCEGVGAFMEIVPEADWHAWLDEAGVLCECSIDGNALCFCDLEDSPFWPPGHAIGQEERAFSGVVPQPGIRPLATAVLARWDHYLYMPLSTGTFYRPGFTYYPYTSPQNPEEHWSPRMGQEVWYYGGDNPACHLTEADLTSPPDGTPMPSEWDSMRCVYEVSCSCDAFGVPPDYCQDEGDSWGSPLVDNWRVGIRSVVDGPVLTLETFHQFMDGFGQRFPLHLEPGDVGNVDIIYDHSRDDAEENDWLGDTAVVNGPYVEEEADRWCVDLCLRIARKGARQALVPGYAEWKTRFAGDPEIEYVCARLDSLETCMGVFANKYQTYFHESDPGFDPQFADLASEQEVLPDGIFSPGTQIDYYYRGYWYNGGAPAEEYTTLGPWGLDILPGMRPGLQDYDVVYPSVLYIDLYNRGSEYYVRAMLDALGLDYDIYDHLGASSCCDAPFSRSYGGTTFNPGGWGNNGMTLQQLLGYRLILFSIGSFGQGILTHNCTGPDEEPDLVLLRDWLHETECGFAELRRGLIMNGDQITSVLAGDPYPRAPEFAHQDLGVTLIADSYGEWNQDPAYCVYLEPVPEGGAFPPSLPGIALYGNGCPYLNQFNVLGLQPDVPGVLGNLRYWSYQQTGTHEFVDFAQVVRERVVPGEANWKSVVDGFSLHHLSERIAGIGCSSDSASVVRAGLMLLQPEITDWLSDPDDPFVAWRYPCLDSGLGDEERYSHLTGPVSHLYAARPNPFTRNAALRFRLGTAGRAALRIHDVTGRLVRVLLDGPREAGEHEIVWDGLDDAGRAVEAGLFWVQLAAPDGYRSCKRMLVLR